MDRLEKAISMFSHHPEVGRPVPRENVRELVEPRYGFPIPYAIIEIPYAIIDGTIFILRVYRSKRKPLDYESLALPVTDKAPSKPKR